LGLRDIKMVTYSSGSQSWRSNKFLIWTVKFYLIATSFYRLGGYYYFRYYIMTKSQTQLTKVEYLRYLKGDETTTVYFVGEARTVFCSETLQSERQ
jgi:hypothetical protein